MRAIRLHVGLWIAATQDEHAKITEFVNKEGLVQVKLSNGMTREFKEFTPIWAGKEHPEAPVLRKLAIRQLREFYRASVCVAAEGAAAIVMREQALQRLLETMAELEKCDGLHKGSFDIERG